MLKTLEKLPDKVRAQEEAGLFEGQAKQLRALAERLAEQIVMEPGLPITAIKVAKADLPDEDVERLEIGFYLKLACDADEAFQWLKRLSSKQSEVAGQLKEKDRKLFNDTFAIAVDWEGPG